ncbi:MAG: phospho-N-acetylmuramoyl-pentapeptide-transferase [Ruminococcaceae bacterium]|nr:phospho-N-acetylmuramoyl-pentapeptide-transferase [Oscillospiraceae bacterium]
MNPYVSYGLVLAVGLALAFGLTVLFGHFALPVLRSKKAGQPINEYVKEHQYKAGTPTMGGISFVPAFLVVMAGFMVYYVLQEGWWSRNLIPLALVCLYAFFNAAIGFVDDYFKLMRRQNEGLTEKQKFLLQVVLAAAFLAMMKIVGTMTTVLHIPFFHVYWDLGWFAYPIYLVVMVGFVNATNITDGLDGLASSVCATVAVFMVVYSLTMTTRSISQVIDVYPGFIGAVLLGCVLGFLVYNHHPAKMFMGDTGSLFLGAVIMGSAVLAGELILFVLAGFMFVIEMLSSLLQRVYYKLSHGKRIFKMAPLHHHFEKCGWKEVKIVGVFSLVSALFCLLAWLGML